MLSGHVTTFMQHEMILLCHPQCFIYDRMLLFTLHYLWSYMLSVQNLIKQNQEPTDTENVAKKKSFIYTISFIN